MHLRTLFVGTYAGTDSSGYQGTFGYDIRQEREGIRTCSFGRITVWYVFEFRYFFMHIIIFFVWYLGDRIISVNGESVSGKSYAEVVGLIQRLRDNLSLIVVPKQDDILQMVSSIE